MARPRGGQKLAEETRVRLVRQSEFAPHPGRRYLLDFLATPRCVVRQGPGDRSCTVFALQRLTSSFPVHNASRPMALGIDCGGHGTSFTRRPTRGRRQRMVHQYVRWTSIRVFRLSRGGARRPKMRSCTTEAEKFQFFSGSWRRSVTALPAGTVARVSIATARLPYRFRRVLRGVQCGHRASALARHITTGIRTTVLDPCHPRTFTRKLTRTYCVAACHLNRSGTAKWS